MAWGDGISGESLAAWFRANGGARPATGWPIRKLNFFGTSMRDFDDVPAQLISLAAGNNLVGADVPQRLSDLRAVGLVQDRPSTQLTELGLAVNAAWIRFDVGQRLDRELARELVVILEAQRLQVSRYGDAMDFCNTLTDHYGYFELLRSWHKLFLIIQLSATHNNYSPLPTLLAEGRLLEAFNEERLPLMAARCAPNDPIAAQGAEAICNRVRQANPRDRHVATSLLAMTLTKVRSEAEARNLIEAFGYPTQDDEWRALHPDDVQHLIDILRAYHCFEGNAAMIELLLRRKNVVLYGPPGTGKTRAALAVVERWQIDYGPNSVFEVTFHPSYGYEDFVWGFRPQANGTFAGTEGILLRACASARERPTLLLIDEINRADTARVFGELITYIEPDKRDRDFYIAQDPLNNRSIPANLFFLGTMNTADRSVSLLDTALRRRFAFVEYRPDPTAFNGTWCEQVAGIVLGQLLTTLNERLSQIGVEPDRAIGHALLGISRDNADPVAALIDRLEHDIYPLVVDFCFADRGRVRQVLGACVDEHARFVATTEELLIPALMDLIQAPAQLP